MERVWMLWLMAETLAADGRHWVRSSLHRRQQAQGLTEYAFTLISVVAICVGIWALLQMAMNAMGQRAATAVGSVK